MKLEEGPGDLALPRVYPLNTMSKSRGHLRGQPVHLDISESLEEPACDGHSETIALIPLKKTYLDQCHFG
jgi:hypothetical protein